jgi:amino acid adenylation domain-containing protein
MLSDSGCRAVISEPRYHDRLGDSVRNILDVRQLLTGTAGDPNPALSETDLAYVIYTSGSTGQPKGVLLEHGGAANLAFAQRTGLGILPTHRILQFAPSSFDASIWELLMALTNGACLVIAAPDDIGDAQAFARLLREKEVSVATLPPSYVRQLTADDLAPLQLLITAGEAPLVDQARMLSRRLRYVNAYGPTESTVCATWHLVDPATEYDGAIPIGRAIANTEVVVLDRDDNLAPIGVIGEICIGGSGLARGYHARPELTAKTFVRHPFRPGARLYRTGDLGLVRADGEIVYKGRSDRQVKIRGHRIELDEIERCLSQHPSVTKAIVDIRPAADGQPDLVAYVVGPSPDSGAILRNHLAQWLPAHMIPTIWVHLDAIPLMANGKIDRSALPSTNGHGSQAEHAQPRNNVEKQIAEAWRAVLSYDGFGLYDRFFEVGGDSIKAIQVVNRLRRAGFKLAVRDLLECPTISDLAARLGGDGNGLHAMQSPPEGTPGESEAATNNFTRVPLSAPELENLFEHD